MQINKKLKNPYLEKVNNSNRLKQQKQNQKSSYNSLYETMKAQSQNKMRFNSLSNDNDFYIKLDHTIQYQPHKVIGKTVRKQQMLKSQHKRRRSLQQAANQPKRSYQMETSSFANSLDKRKVGSNNMTDSCGNGQQQEGKEWRRISRTSTGFVRTLTTQSLQPKSISINLKQKHHIPFNQHRHNKSNLSQQQPHQLYTNALTTLIQSTKQCSSSIYKQQKRLNIVSSIQQKVYKHFDKLALNQKELEYIDFIDLNSITKPERYMFNTNNLLENLLLKDDTPVRDWIEKEDKRQFRKNTIEIVHQKLNDNLINSKCIKYKKCHTQTVNNQQPSKPKQLSIKQSHPQMQTAQNNPIQRLPYQPKRVKNIISMKAAASFCSRKKNKNNELLTQNKQ